MLILPHHKSIHADQITASAFSISPGGMTKICVVSAADPHRVAGKVNAGDELPAVAQGWLAISLD